MLKLLRRKSSFRRSKDFKKEGDVVSRRRSASSAAGVASASVEAGLGTSSGRSHHHRSGGGSVSQDSIVGPGGQYTQKTRSVSGDKSNKDSQNQLQPPAGGGGDSRFSSWDRRSQASGSGGHRFYSISTNTLGEGGRDSPPQILQYARPPENLTSPNRESTAGLQDSLTLSPSTEKRVAKERSRLLREEERKKSQQRQYQHLQHKQQQQQVPKRGEILNNSGSSGGSGVGGGGVISSLRQSFKKKSRKTSAPAAPSECPPSIHLPLRKLSSSSAGGRYTPTGDLISPSSTTSSRRSGSVSSFKGAANNPQQHRHLLPGRAASPGKPVQVVAPFQQTTQLQQRIPEEDEKMRDPTLVQVASTTNHHLHNNNATVEQTTSMERSATSSVSTSSAQPQPVVRQQRCLPQTPKQASRTGLVPAASSASSSNSANVGRSATKASAVVSPVQHQHSDVTKSSSHHHSSSSSSAPRPAQRLSLRHKVRLQTSVENMQTMIIMGFSRNCLTAAREVYSKTATEFFLSVSSSCDYPFFRYLSLFRICTLSSSCTVSNLILTCAIFLRLFPVTSCR
jgi:hypothetical protein